MGGTGCNELGFEDNVNGIWGTKFHCFGRTPEIQLANELINTRCWWRHRFLWSAWSSRCSRTRQSPVKASPPRPKQAPDTQRHWLQRTKPRHHCHSLKLTPKRTKRAILWMRLPRYSPPSASNHPRAAARGIASAHTTQAATARTAIADPTDTSGHSRSRGRWWV